MTGSGGVPVGLVVALAAVVGLFVGSFLNVVVYRVPLGLSVSRPRSFCTTCDRQLRWWENVPVVSWLALRGRCHRCHEPVSARYPLVEAATALVFAAVAWGWHGSSVTAGYCALAATTVAVCLIEWGGARAPLSVAASGAALGTVAVVVTSVWIGRGGIAVGALTGLAVGAVVLGAVRHRDPDCRDPRGHGRSLLLVVGCWLGGLAGVTGRGGWSLVWGLVGWIVGAFACLVVLWLAGRNRRRAGTDGRFGRWLEPVASVPLATGVVVALGVSLAVAG